MSKPSLARKKILFIRLDRIGDLVLSLPVDEAFPPDVQKTWWVPPGLKFITDSASPRRQAEEVAKKISFKKFWCLLREIRKENYQTAIVFHAPWWVSLLLFLARVPERVGVKSQWHSFLFLNRSVRQKRSRAQFSELEYNYRLVEVGLGLGLSALPRRSLKLHSDVDITKFGLEPNEYTVVHPGMGGSALNWPIEKYLELIRTLLKREKVVITGTAADEVYLNPLRTALAVDESPINLVWLDAKLDGPALISVLGSARAVIAPSTGVLHLAASTSVATLGLFSPVRVQKPERWGPQGPKVEVFVPLVDCPGQMKCIGPICPHFFCMNLITPADVVHRMDSHKPH